MTSPAMMPVWMAAPMAIPSSGLTARLGSLPKTLRTTSADLGGAGLAAHQQHLVDLLGLQAGVGEAARQGSMVRSSRSSVSASYFCRESTVLRCLGPEASAEMKGRTISVCCAVESSHLAFSAASFRRCRAMRSWRRSMLVSRWNSLDQPVDDALVEVLAAQEGVAAGGAHLEQALRQLQDRDVEGAAAEVVDGHELPARVLEAVGQGGRGGLVDDARDLEAGDQAGVLGGLALGVVEVGGDGDDGLVHRLAEVVLGRRLQLLQHEGRDLGRGVDLVVDLDVHVAVGRLHERVGEDAARLAPPRATRTCAR